jgi:hypothetical protein
MSARHDHRRAGRRAAVAWTLALIAAAAVGLVLLLSGGSKPGRRPSASPAARSLAALATPANPARRSVERHPGAQVRTATPSPGSLPQTHAYPWADTQLFRSLMAALWAGVVRDSLSAALPAFFPRGAYVQLKAIASTGSDWRSRLVHDYSLDIAAAHALLGPDPSSAQLVAVKVPSSYGHWVPPGVCYNDVGYYEVPNARVVYRENGQVSSFGIASMISWRGVWYVVHLGAILRSGDSGMADEPSSGSGTSAYSGTC